MHTNDQITDWEIYRAATAEKQKRKQRDALFKQQAEERKKEEAASATALAEATAAAEAEDQEVLEALASKSKAAAVPKLLPLDYLTDASSDDEDDAEEEGEKGEKKQKKTREDRIAAVEKGLKRKERGPRDEVVGSTVYRVMKERDERLAPKVTKYAQGQKAALLRRDRPVVKARSGFIVKR
jgi:hypothetical protein